MMAKTGTPRPALLALALAFFSSGCTYYRPTQTGFLGDYSQLKRDPVHMSYAVGFQRAKTHDATPEAMRKIDSFYIEPAQWLVDPNCRAAKDAYRKGDLTNRLDDTLRDQLGAIRPIVDSPGPNTATIRSAITTVRISRPLTNVLLTATYFTPWAIGPVFFGGAAIEAEAIGPDGKQVAAVTAAGSGGFLDILGYYTKSGHARKAIRRDAKELREALDH